MKNPPHSNSLSQGARGKRGTESLAQLLILDLANETGSFCSKILASLGATVIKIEKPDGDPSRAIGPFYQNRKIPDNSLFFWYNNADKQGITLNLNTAPGRDIFRKLVKKADVLIETCQSGYLEKKHTSYDYLKKINPCLIMTSITPFGKAGPYKMYKSCDLVASASGGTMYLSGKAGKPPLKSFGFQSYYLASLFAAVGILLALQQRKKLGKGQHIDISLQEVTASESINAIVRFFTENKITRRMGAARRDKKAGIFPCQDGHIFLTYDRERDILIDWMNSENNRRVENRGCKKTSSSRHSRESGNLVPRLTSTWIPDQVGNDILEPVSQYYIGDNMKCSEKEISEWTKSHRVGELFKKAQLMRFPWAPLQNIHQVVNDPQLRARRFFKPVEHDNLGRTFMYPSLPVNGTCKRPEYRKRAPLVGEHNFQIYHDMLGLSRKQLEGLAKKNVT